MKRKYLQWEFQETRKKGTESILKAIMAEISPNMGRETNIQIQEAQKTSNRLNLNRATPRHVIIRQVKDRILKATKEKRN